ncbi:MAG: YraN family protein [Deltaproteobacteria bacterium]|nr:YraN family protein [Deltaproteobacteria bacterium]
MKRPANRPPTPPSPEPPARGPERSAEADRASLGRRGEDAAAHHLAARGYQIIARNVRVDRVELDLIARRGDAIVFVEVKTRRGVRHGQAAEAVDARKQRRLRHGAQAWLATRPAEAQGARRHRFDVVTCLLLEDGARNETSAPEAARWSIEQWESAF